MLLGLAAGDEGFDTVGRLLPEDLTDEGLVDAELLPRDTVDLLSECEPLLLLVWASASD